MGRSNRSASWIERLRTCQTVVSAVMSKATKRKHVTREVVEEFVEPEGEQKIVKVRCKS